MFAAVRPAVRFILNVPYVHPLRLLHLLFKNFIRNSFRALNDASVAKLWDYLDGIRNEISVKEKEATAAAIDVPVPTAPAVATPEGDENPKEKKKSAKGYKFEL